MRLLHKPLSIHFKKEIIHPTRLSSPKRPFDERTMNKQVAAELGMTEKTVKFHRGHIMRKVGAQSLAELVRMADQL